MTPDEWFEAPLTPLGDPHTGRCATSCDPSIETQRDLCNFGYARGRCPHCAAGDAPDAIRFSLAPGAAAIRYSIERDHLPLAAGELDPALLDGTPLHRQAGAYYESYLRRLL